MRRMSMLGAMAMALRWQFDPYGHHFDMPKGSTPNKYQPHQGKREIARRARKIQRASMKYVLAF